MSKAKELAESYVNGNIGDVKRQLKSGSKKLLLDFVEELNDYDHNGLAAAKRMMS